MLHGPKVQYEIYGRVSMATVYNIYWCCILGCEHVNPFYQPVIAAPRWQQPASSKLLDLAAERSPNRRVCRSLATPGHTARI